MKKKKLIPIFILAICLSGCLGRQYFTEGVLIERNLQKEKIVQLANNSDNIVDFINEVYATPPQQIFENKFSTGYILSKTSKVNIWDLDIFKIYCSEKKGVMYKWLSPEIPYGVISRIFYVCEIDGEINSALQCDVKRNENRKTFPYLVYVYYLEKDLLKKQLANKIEYNAFISSNNVARFLLKSGSYKNDYLVEINYQNKTGSPKAINFNNLKVQVSGITYDVDFKSWESYFGGFRDYFVVNNEKTDETKIKLNPNQSIQSCVMNISIPGLSLKNESDFKDIIFILDDVECNNFAKTSLYSIQKDRVF
jgi:hypothetical protein